MEGTTKHPICWDMNPLSLHDFRSLFSPNIRAALNWNLLEVTESKIETRIITKHEELEELFTVWHVSPSGSYTDWSAPDAVPQTIKEAINGTNSWQDDRKLRVRLFQEQYKLTSEPVNLLLPVYQVGSKFVLLDSTHRVTAITQARLGFTALLVAITGPIDERVLPDLRWHAYRARNP